MAKTTKNTAATKEPGKISKLFEGIVKEAKRVRWPKFSELLANTGKVLVFCILFAIFFVICDFVVSNLLLLLGIGA